MSILNGGQREAPRQPTNNRLSKLMGKNTQVEAGADLDIVKDENFYLNALKTWLHDFHR